MPKPEYEIRRLADFAKVPKDRRVECLGEFLVALEFYEATIDLTSHEFVFRWIDDGENKMKITYKAMDPDQRRGLSITYEGKMTEDGQSS